MTPEQEAQDRLRRAIVDDEFPDAEQVEQSPFAAVIPDPLAFERNAAVSAWMSQASGRNVDAGTPTWQAEKDALAQGFFKMPTAKGITDSEIHGLVRQHVMTAEEAVMDGINAALAGRPLLETVSAFDTKAGASKLRAKWPEYSQEMRKYYDATEARVAPYRDIIKSSAAQLGKEMETGLPATDAFKAVADQLLEIPEADRRIVIKAMAATGGDTPDAQRSYLGKLGAAFGRMSEGMGASVESGVSDLIYSMAASGGIKDVNPEAASALRQQGQTTRSYYQLANMVRKVADSDISPIEAEGFLAETGIGLARMGPMLVGSTFAPTATVATMASFYRDDVAANLMLEYEGLDAAKADKIALVAAPGIAALEHASNLLPFGKLPGVGSFLKSSITSIKAGIIRGGTLVAAGTGGEIAEEVFQEIAPKLVQDLFAEVDKEVPGVNWTDEKKKLEKIPAQVFGPALAVSLIGGGVVSVNDVKHGRAISSDRDTLIASGYAPSMADDIALKSKEGDWAGVDALMRSAYDRKKGGISGATEKERKAAIESIQAKILLQQSAIDTLRNNGDLARMANIGGKWVVTRPDGSAPVAFDNPDDADALVWQDAKERKLRIHAVYRDIISQANRSLAEGQELAFIFSPEKMTPEAAVEAGLVSAQAVEGRKKQLAALDEGKLEDQDFTRAEKEAQAEGDTDAVYTILGMNNIENREGVSRGVIRLFQGANFTDLIEEIAEVGFKRHFGSKDANRPAMLASLRQAEGAIQRAEQATGMEPTLLFRTKDDAQISDSDLIEAFSHLAKSYYINAVEQGGTSADWRTKNKSVPRYLRTLRAALANTEIFKWVKAMGEKLGTIYKRASMIQSVREGEGLDTNLELLIRRSVGLDTQDQMEAGILQEAHGMAEEAGMSMAAPSMSLSKGDQSLEQRLAAMFDPFQKNPEQRRKLGLIAKDRVAKVAAEYADVVAMAGATREKLAALDTKYSEELAASRADYQAEMKVLRDERDFELEGAKQQKETKANIEKIKADYAARIAARDKAWEKEKGDLELRQSNERGAIQRGLGKLDTESLRQAIRTLGAAISIMPSKVVAKILPGGVNELFRIKTDAGRLEAIERLVVKADVELEKFLRKDIGQKLDKQLAAAAVKGKGGEIPKSKFIVTVQDELDEITRIASQSASDTSIEIIQTEALLTAAPDDESAADATAKLALLEIFGDVFGKTSSAEQMANASDYLTKLMKEGRESRKLLDKDRQQALRIQIEQAKADAYKGKAGADTVQAGKDKGKGTVKGTFKKFARELFSHKAVLSSLFGESEKTANTFDERLILNTNAFEDTQNDRRKRMRDFMRALYGTKWTIKLNHAINSLEIKKKNTGITMTKGRVTKRDEQDVEAVSEILKNPANFGYSAKEAQAWQEEMDAWAILPENRKRKLFIEREIEKGDRVELELSQMEAVYITMALRQPGILEQQEMHGFDQTTLDQAEKFLTKDAKAWRAYMQAEYDAEYEVANAVFMRMFNTRLPRIRFYAPLLKNHQGAQAALDPLNTGVTKQSINPGSIKSRNARSSSLRIESALAVYQAHFVQMDYWVHMAEYLRDVQGVMLNSEVRDAIVSAHGEESMNALSAWIEIEMSRGVTKSALAIQGSKMMRNIKQGINFKALAFNIGTAIKSTDSAVRSLSEIPLQRWPVAMKNGLKYWNKLRKSNILQNRFELGGTVEMREINANAGRSKWWAVDGLEILLKNGTFATKYWDLWMTSFSAAMAYGDSYQQALDANPDISEQQADAYARKQTEIIVTRTSMPVNAFGKSLIEADTKGLAAMVMIFVSDPRQKAGLVGEAIMNWRRGGIGNEEVVRRILANWIIPGIIFQTMHAVVRSMFKNDDEEWTVEEFITAAMVGPLQGVAILGSSVESFVSYAVATAAELITGEESKRKNPFFNSSNPIQEASLELVRSMDKLPEKIEQGEMMSGAWDIIKAGGLITTPFNPAGAAPSTFDRVAKDTTTFFYELTGEND